VPVRVERIFESRGIRDELDACNPLIPDASMREAVQSGTVIAVGTEHPAYLHLAALPVEGAQALARDLG